MEESLYDILQLDRKSSTDEIKSAYRSLAKQYHPDIVGPNSKHADRYQKIRSAYEILSDSGLRKNYDQSLREEVFRRKKEENLKSMSSLDICTKIEIILAFSTTRPSFNPSFANSCLNRMAEGKELTWKQLEAIDNIIISFNIDLEYWKDENKRKEAINKLLEKESPFSSFVSEEIEEKYV